MLALVSDHVMLKASHATVECCRTFLWRHDSQAVAARFARLLLLPSPFMEISRRHAQAVKDGRTQSPGLGHRLIFSRCRRDGSRPRKAEIENRFEQSPDSLHVMPDFQAPNIHHRPMRNPESLGWPEPSLGPFRDFRLR